MNILNPQEIADLTMEFQVPLDIRYDRLESLKWRIAKAIELDRQQMFSNLIDYKENEKVYHY